MLLPIFETKRLVLKAVTDADIPAYEKYFVDYELIQHLSAQVPWPYPKDGVKWFLDNVIYPTQGLSAWLWGIYLKENPTELIGAVHLWRDGKPENRGFWLGRPFWGKGYMTEAVEPVMDYAFTNLGFEKLIFANAVGNIKSRRVKEKTGARLLYIEPAKFVNPKYTEHEIWELKKEDWKKMNPLIYQLKESRSEDDRRKCIPLLKEHLLTHEKDTQAWYDLAGCYDFCGDELEAEHCYQKVYELGRQNLTIEEQKGFFVGYGSTLRNNKKLSQSIEILNQGVKVFPDYPALKTFLALSLYSNQQYKESSEALFQTLLQMPENSFDGYDKAVHWYIKDLRTEK